MSCNSQGAEQVSGNVFLRHFNFEKKGESVKGDLHNFDHTTFVSRGSVHVRKWRRVVDALGRPVIVEALDIDPITGVVSKKPTEQWLVEIERDFFVGQHFLVEANKKHDIIALEDHSHIVCIYSHRNAQGEVIEYFDGWMPAYV